MKRILIVSMTFFLSGCPSIADRSLASYPAQVELKKEAVCIKVSPENDEKLEAISLYREGNYEQRENVFFDEPLILSSEDCLPTQGYHFVPHVNYHLSAKLTSLKKKNAGVFPYSREFETEFYLEKKEGKLRIIKLSRGNDR